MNMLKLFVVRLWLCAAPLLWYAGLATSQNCGGLLDSVLTRLNALESQATALEGQVNGLEMQGTTFQGQLTALQGQGTSLQNQVTTLQTQSQKHAAFSASMEGSELHVNISDTAAVRFPAVITNIGYGYDPQTGYFTAPYAGTYVFYFHMRSSNAHSWIVVSIYKEKQELLAATADGASNPWNRGNVLVTTHLNAGDKVYCRRRDGSTWVEGGFLTNFSGALIHAD